jgi:aspartate/methionine/tyrosine aminotransferase
MNELAVELNNQIKAGNSHVYDMLSPLGRELYFPKGILTQTAEATARAKRFNATIGMAMEEGHAMFVGSVMDQLRGPTPDEALTYAPGLGLPELRKAWLDKQVIENPSQKGKVTTLPIATNGLTHGLSIVGDLFVGAGDALLLPDKLWGNYRLIYGTRLGAKISYHPFFNAQGGLDVQGFQRKLDELCAANTKVMVLLNFPNNPVGYTPTVKEGEAVCRSLVAAAERGTNVIALTDDAYFGLAYTADAMKESLFGMLASAHPRLLAIKGDAATKELYVWGLRVGFLTFGPAGVQTDSPLLAALEKKVAGSIRGCMSNCSRLSQSVILKALRAPGLSAQRRAKYDLMKARADKVREVLRSPKYAEVWEPYPFNSGYFMCVRMKGVNAEELRKHMLDKYGVGLISIGDEDIRVAYSCLEVGQIQELFDLLYAGAKELAGR